MSQPWVEQGSEDSRPEVPVTTNPTKSPLKEFSVLDAFRRDGKFSLAHIPPPPLPAHTHKDAGRHLPMAFLPRQESPGIPFLTPTGRGMRLGRPDMVPPMMPPGMLPQNRGFVARNMLLPPPPARLLYLPPFGRMDREHGLGLRPRFPAHHQVLVLFIQ
uniref:Uncharacterized protein n=1 Tax=Timema douglasi TaxID=61478 RepID=A0A7R8VW62_TIMDO|nr:unnamed protein product [Timema douglasi]